MTKLDDEARKFYTGMAAICALAMFLLFIAFGIAGFDLPPDHVVYPPAVEIFGYLMVISATCCGMAAIIAWWEERP